MKHIQQRNTTQSRHPSPPNAVYRGALPSSSVVASSPASQTFPIQKVEVIPAEVTLVKCNLEVPTSHNNSMVVDISFNQRGGVNAADFLEAVDRYVDAYQAVQMGTPSCIYHVFLSKAVHSSVFSSPVAELQRRASVPSCAVHSVTVDPCHFVTNNQAQPLRVQLIRPSRRASAVYTSSCQSPSKLSNKLATEAAPVLTTEVWMHIIQLHLTTVQLYVLLDWFIPEARVQTQQKAPLELRL